MENRRKEMTPLEKEKFDQIGEYIDKLSSLFYDNSDTLSDFVYTRDEMQEEEVEEAWRIWEDVQNTFGDVRRNCKTLDEHFKEIEDE